MIPLKQNLYRFGANISLLIYKAIFKLAIYTQKIRTIKVRTMRLIGDFS